MAVVEDPPGPGNSGDRSFVEKDLKCANCGSVNPPRAMVCGSCGISFAAYEVAKKTLAERERARKAAYDVAVTESAAEAMAVARHTSRRWFLFALGALGVAVVVLGLLIVGVWVLYSTQARERDERLAAAYAGAEACLVYDDNLCARNGFAALLRDDPRYPGATERLREARFRLAEQYSNASLWKDAIAELDAILEGNPGDPRALVVMRGYYDNWIAARRAQGDWLGEWQITRQRQQRFPGS